MLRVLDVLLLALNGEEQFQSVLGPLGKEVVARWGWVAEQRLAIIEVAQACGLHLSGGNPTHALHASTVGVGELVIAAAKFGAEKIIVATGGSATNPHVLGKAVDISVTNEKLSDADQEKISEEALKRIDGVGLFKKTRLF